MRGEFFRESPADLRILPGSSQNQFLRSWEGAFFFSHPSIASLSLVTPLGHRL